VEWREADAAKTAGKAIVAAQTGRDLDLAANPGAAPPRRRDAGPVVRARAAA
jgi:hypothetical protein